MAVVLKLARDIGDNGTARVKREVVLYIAQGIGT